MSLEQDVRDVAAWLSVVYPSDDLRVVVSLGTSEEVVCVALDRSQGGRLSDASDEAARALVALGYEDPLVRWGRSLFASVATSELSAHERATGYLRVQSALDSSTYSPTSLTVLEGLDQAPRRPGAG